VASEIIVVSLVQTPFLYPFNERAINYQREMIMPTTPAETLYELITTRHTVRHFAPEVPPQTLIEEIIRAGFYAPYAILGVDTKTALRRFIALQRGSEAREAVHALFLKHARRIAHISRFGIVRRAMRLTDRLRIGRTLPLAVYDQTALLANHAETQRRHFLHMANAPYYRIVAEQKRVPLVVRDLEWQSLAHCLQNMWFMASAMGLPFSPYPLPHPSTVIQPFVPCSGLPRRSMSLMAV